MAKHSYTRQYNIQISTHTVPAHMRNTSNLRYAIHLDRVRNMHPDFHGGTFRVPVHIESVRLCGFNVEIYLIVDAEN